MDQQQQSRWRRIGRQVLWTVGVVAAVSAVVFVINRFFVHHPLWDWLKLLIVPAVLAGGGLWFNTQQREREQQTAEHRTQDDTLEAYLDVMSRLLTDNETEREQNIVSLRQAYLSEAYLSEADLSGAYLFKANLAQAYLFRADLNTTMLSEADLSGANLNIANLRGANLSGATLLEADLSRANLGKANLVGAVLSKTNLTKADLREADLHGADLVGSDLRQASGVTNDQLKYQAESLERATMPNGQKYEDWIKDKGG